MLTLKIIPGKKKDRLKICGRVYMKKEAFVKQRVEAYLKGGQVLRINIINGYIDVITTRDMPRETYVDEDIIKRPFTKKELTKYESLSLSGIGIYS